ncbi:MULTISPECIES: AI-2E family transporter [unclassified Spirosoma]|uniref:AI-2E family transporter n=1 Tax=unclassified Spirosoma TaxID=2621999 RepID=UPI000964C6AA|nr:MULTISPECIES: AI-2E family transporter [unclassified Spirosoma]MBN8825375.1 AI-2E family transporter [Spirosoma sp.]OJW77458.1 MAG: AI-2E family transporter [Spirosoma sp. 48-14]
MTDDSTRPHYHQFSHSLLAMAILTAGIYLGQDILVPLALSGLIAVLLRPIENWLTRLGMHKVIAISLALLIAIILITGVTVLISLQLSDFTDDVPKIRDHINDFVQDAKRWVRREYNVSYRQQEKYLQKAQAQTLNTLQSPDTLGVITGPLGTILLMPIYVFLLLYYRSMLLHFIIVLFPEKHTERVRVVMGEVKAVIQSYMVGLLIETACVAALNSIGLMILGVQYAILLGVMAAILNLIPYIGGLVATGLTVLVTFSTNPEISVILGVVGIFLFVQFIDNNVLVPLIVASKVRINALVSIVGVLIGGALAGVSGMFLSIPAIAIMKVVFDRVDSLRAWGVLLGDQTPEEAGSNLFRLQRRRKKAKEEA